jgi:hypothetical protein
LAPGLTSRTKWPWLSVVAVSTVWRTDWDPAGWDSMQMVAPDIGAPDWSVSCPMIWAPLPKPTVTCSAAPPPNPASRSAPPATDDSVQVLSTMDVYAQLEQRVDRSHGESFDRLVRTAREQTASISPAIAQVGTDATGTGSGPFRRYHSASAAG